MKVITERDMILDVVRRWEEQYSGEFCPSKQHILTLAYNALRVRTLT